MPITTGFMTRSMAVRGEIPSKKPTLDFVSVLKYNMCHAPGTGRFCETGGGKTGGGGKPVEAKAKAPVKAKAKEAPKETPKEEPKAKAKEAPKETSKPKEETKKPESGFSTRFNKPISELTPEQRQLEADLAKQAAKSNAIVLRRWLQGDKEVADLSDREKEFYQIPKDAVFGSKLGKTKPSKGTGKPSDVKSDHAHTQTLLDADTHEGVTAALTKMGWKTPPNKKNAAHNNALAKEVRAQLFTALANSPRGVVKVKTKRGKGKMSPEEVATQNEAEALQKNADLLLHPEIARQLPHKSVWFQEGHSQGQAHFTNLNEGMITFGSVPERDRAAVYVHEFGHKIEAQTKGMLAKAKRAVNSGQTLVNAYSSTEYDTVRGTEYVSSGYEHYYRDPVGFAAKAPEHFAFIHRQVTRGVIS